MMTGSKGPKLSCACTNEILILGPAQHEEVAKCLKIKHFSGFRMFVGLRELLGNVAIRGISWGQKNFWSKHHKL